MENTKSFYSYISNDSNIFGAMRCPVFISRVEGTDIWNFRIAGWRIVKLGWYLVKGRKRFPESLPLLLLTLSSNFDDDGKLFGGNMNIKNDFSWFLFGQYCKHLQSVEILDPQGNCFPLIIGKSDYSYLRFRRTRFRFDLMPDRPGVFLCGIGMSRRRNLYLILSLFIITLIYLIIVGGWTAGSSLFIFGFSIICVQLFSLSVFLIVKNANRNTSLIRATDAYKEEMKKNRRIYRMGKSKKKERDVVRFQFEIAPELWNEMQKFQEAGGMTTKRELLNNALTLFRWAALHVQRGNAVNAVSPDGTVYELQMPSLENIALQGKPSLELVSSSTFQDTAMEQKVKSKSNGA